jgi:ParB family chromosome partitioning protein
MNKKTQRRVLGRGLASLIPMAAGEEEPTSPDEGREILEIECEAIKPNPGQPRSDFNEDEIKSLADSINIQGLLQPILVRRNAEGGFEIVSGERRFRALRRLGRDKIPCIVRQSVSDREMMEMALVENIQREDLNEMEKAVAYQRLIGEYSYTHEELSAQMGKSRATVTNTLRLLALPDEIQQMVRKNELTMGHARALLAIEGDERRIELAKRITAEDLPVRAVEKKARADAEPKKPRAPKPGPEVVADPIVAEAVSRLQYRLGTAVALKSSDGRRGTIEIEYYSEPDLTRLFDLLLPAPSPSPTVPDHG